MRTNWQKFTPGVEITRNKKGQDVQVVDGKERKLTAYDADFAKRARKAKMSEEDIRAWLDMV